MIATIKKELLLLLRDPGGLLLLLIMPAVLIIVMSTVQDAPFKDYNTLRFKMIVVNNDKGNVGDKIINQLKKSKNFEIIDTLNGQALNEQILNTKLKSGDYPLGIIIPKNTTAALINKSNDLSNTISKSMGMPASMPVNEANDSAAIQMIFDPASQSSFRTSLSFALNQYIAQAQMQLLLERMAKSSGDTTTAANVLNKSMQALYVKEVPGGDGKQVIASINSVQHNVPAWAIFGMFLIVVPIAGNMIRERDEGSSVRLQLIPNAATNVALGKIIFYILLCLVQFCIMMLIGIFIIPLIGLPKLYLGSHAIALIPMAIAIAFAATAYGFFIGSVFKTANQAMSVGAISVVLVAAIGGVWVPVEILPKFMQQVANISPLHWSLKGINDIILRGYGIFNIGLPIGILLLFGSVLTIIGVRARRE